MKTRKSIFLIFSWLFLCFMFIPNNINITHAYSVSGYARIKNSNTYLYKNAESNENVKNKWCLLEPTYFVQILNRFNDDYFKVNYNGVTGYVKQTEVLPVNETPKIPYPENVNFDLTNTNCYLRSTPLIKDMVNNIIETIPASTKNLNYIGKIIGEEAIDFKGSTWYLINYSDIFGYLYSGYTLNITPVFPNGEQVTKKNYNMFQTINPISNPTVAFMIALILLPCLFIIVLLYKPHCKRLKIKNKHKEKVNTADSTNMFDEPDL